MLKLIQSKNYHRYFLFGFLLFIFMFFLGCEKFTGSPVSSPTPQVSSPQPKDTEKLLFERDLKSLVNKGYFVAVDKNESDKFIQENIYSKDSQVVENLARIKSESLGISLFIEDKSTLGNSDYIIKVHPTDRKATQSFFLLESQLLDPSYFKKKEYLDNINRAEAMDKQKTVPKMMDFIRKYPDSIWVPRAISYIEYQLCAVQKNPDLAILKYRQLEKEFPGKKELLQILDDYEKRALQYREKYSE